jgi:hypothetical protein
VWEVLRTVTGGDPLRPGLARCSVVWLHVAEPQNDSPSVLIKYEEDRGSRIRVRVWVAEHVLYLKYICDRVA